jgi:hypothetical protein
MKGTSDLPRISCANHKLNLVIKTSMRFHKTILKHVKKLNKFITNIKHTVELTKMFANEKCRLRLDNVTRWGSTFLMLERLQKAHNKGLFNNKTVELPLSIDVIKSYLRVLKEPYLLNISLQRDTCSISEVIPSVLFVIHRLESLSKRTSKSCKKLCEFIIEQLKIRFKYEFESDMYKVKFSNNSGKSFFKCFPYNSSLLQFCDLHCWQIGSILILGKTIMKWV